MSGSQRIGDRAGSHVPEDLQDQRKGAREIQEVRSRYRGRNSPGCRVNGQSGVKTHR